MKQSFKQSCIQLMYKTVYTQKIMNQIILEIIILLQNGSVQCDIINECSIQIKRHRYVQYTAITTEDKNYI